MRVIYTAGPLYVPGHSVPRQLRIPAPPPTHIRSRQREGGLHIPGSPVQVYPSFAQAGSGEILVMQHTVSFGSYSANQITHRVQASSTRRSGSRQAKCRTVIGCWDRPAEASDQPRVDNHRARSLPSYSRHPASFFFSSRSNALQVVKRHHQQQRSSVFR